MWTLIAIALAADTAPAQPLASGYMPARPPVPKRAPASEEHTGMIMVRTGEFALTSSVITAGAGVALYEQAICHTRCDNPLLVIGPGIVGFAAIGAVPALVLMVAGDDDVTSARARMKPSVALVPMGTGLALRGTW